jgi:hypothetical protein
MPARETTGEVIARTTPDGINRNAKGELLWMTADFHVMTLKSMEEMHLLNCMKMIIGLNWRSAYLLPIQEELTRRELDRRKQAALVQLELSDPDRFAAREV